MGPRTKAATKAKNETINVFCAKLEQEFTIEPTSAGSEISAHNGNQWLQDFYNFTEKFL